MANVHAVQAAHTAQVVHKPAVVNKPPVATASTSSANNPQSANGNLNSTQPQDLFIPSQPQGSQGSGGSQGSSGSGTPASGGSSGSGTPASGGSSGSGSSNSLMQLLMMLLALLTQGGAGKNSPLGNNPTQAGQGQTAAQSPLGINGVVA